jgi:hypothetical protein
MDVLVDPAAIAGVFVRCYTALPKTYYRWGRIALPAGIKAFRLKSIIDDHR